MVLAPDADPSHRTEVLGRVLVGDITDHEACAELAVRPTVLARWKLQALEAIEAFDVDAPAPAPAPHPDPVSGPVPATSPARPRAARAATPIEPRTVAAGATGLVGFAVAAVLITPVASLTALAALNRWLGYTACLLAVGGAVYLWRIHDHRGHDDELGTLRWWIQAGAVVGAVAGLLTLAFQGAVMAGAGPFVLLDPRAAARAADGSLGVSTALRLIGLAYLLYAARSLAQRRTSGVVAAVGGGLVLVSFLLVGHSATSEPRVLVAGANLLHTGAASLWFGGLVLLAVTLRHRRRGRDLPGAAAIVQRFSWWAMGSVAAVVVAGVALAIVELPRPAALLTSTYGVMIVAKLVLLGVLLVVARQNHQRIVPALAAGRAEAWEQLRRTVGVEVGGIVLILLATGLLVNLPQPT